MSCEGAWGEYLNFSGGVIKDHKEKTYLVETYDDNDKYILGNMGSNSFSERVFLFEFSVKPTLKQSSLQNVYLLKGCCWSTRE